MRQAEWRTIEAGEQLLAENRPLERLILLLSGEAKVISQGQEVARLGAGQFAGEMSFLTGEDTSANVVADGTVLYAEWPRQNVSEMIRRDQDLGNALQSALGNDLVRKILKGRDSPIPVAEGV